ncbi:N-acetylglucosamine-6-phosphate deacetylase [Pseudarthrobacter sp. NamE5]|uniref:N-acetylglucosamine-6-phosphate deacetylase n=1 Tax=Pseudarthrobacter sp. NamE5 TaxID=2576839 RepID=UPI00110BB19D|nr:amidohydrolase family protein [Pseudarthrobacter sp. NamE5]TLM83533.1 N-acetylglucosamine-6-phosphate deacetylase [Pseudarthrobacter sp. NamE5]
MRNELILRGRLVSATMDVPDGVLAVDAGLVTYAGPTSGFPGKPTPAHGEPQRILLPGLVDLHCHGALGSDFSEGSLDGARSAARQLHSRGTTTLLASLVTGTPDDLIRNLKALRTLTDEGLVAGAHLEGPFLSPEQCGAHDPGLLREPDAALLARLLDAAGPHLTCVTLAAELPGAVKLMQILAARGIIPSLGHTAADARTAAAFLEEAAVGLAGPSNSTGRLRPTVTHLFNAMPSLHHRSPGPVAASLSAARAGNAVVELIADGVHLAPETVKMVFELVGAENIALVTDSMAATGLQDGQYRLGALAVTVEGGVARVEGSGAIAGGTAILLDVVRATVAAGVTLQEATTAASAVPASVLGLSGQVGDLREGMHADVVVVDEDLQLAGVLRRGEWVTPPARGA